MKHLPETSTMSEEETIPEVELPRSVKLCINGLLFTDICLLIGGGITKVIDFFIPGFQGNGIPPWLWPILILIWTPGIAGLVVAYFVIMRYPYLSLAIGWQPTLTSSSWVFTILGWIFYILSPAMLLAALTGSNTSEVVGCIYVGVELAFVGFLLATYNHKKHPTIATFLLLTGWVGGLLFPFYLPVILVGSIRCRYFLSTLEE